MAGEKHLIVTGGATASGKTTFAIHLAQHYGIPILSADSRQVFRELTIGTAKPIPEELSQAPHYFINSRSVEAPYSVGAYERDALAQLEKIYSGNDLALLVGGSGLYLKAVCHGLDDFPPVSDAARQQIQTLLDKKGLPGLQEALLKKDPDYYREVDLQNPHRLLRALSVIEETGKPFSSFRHQLSRGRPFRPLFLQLHLPRLQLYQRINQRVDHMVEKGLEEEARRMMIYRYLPALQTVGYQEWFDFFDGKRSREETIALIKQSSRRYAKRQLSWYRRDGYWKHFRPEETALAISFIDQCRSRRWKFSCTEHELPNRRKITIEGDKEMRCSFGEETLNGERLFRWLQAHAPNSLAEKMLWHEMLLRAEETDGWLILPADAELYANKVGCKPVEEKQAGRGATPPKRVFDAASPFSLWKPPPPKNA